MDSTLKNQRYFFSVFCLCAMVFAVRYWLNYYGNMNGSSLGVLAMKFCPPLAALFTCLHWALQALSPAALESFTQWQQVLMAQIVYVIIVFALIAVIASPLLVYMLPTRNDQSIHLPYQANLQHVIPTLYNQLKVRLNKGLGVGGGDEKPPMVYGLGSAYSASIVALMSVLCLLLSLLLNDGMAPSLFVATLAMYLCLELYSAATASSHQGLDGDRHSSPLWSGVIMLSLLSSLFFYATGHQATIPNIRFKSAYTGFYGNFNTVILPGILIWLNTFAGPVFFTLACPLLIFWPALSSQLVKWMVKRTLQQQQKQDSWQGDFSLYDNATQLRHNMFRIACTFVVIASIKLLCAASAAALHRRHLMVWKIFAPRFVYEGALFLTTAVCILLACLFVFRVDNAITKFVKNLRSPKES